jgi:hypothetical protein
MSRATFLGDFFTNSFSHPAWEDGSQQCVQNLKKKLFLKKGCPGWGLNPGID